MTDPTPDNTAALAFLERWCPGGPWVLTAIRPDRRSVATATFSAATMSAAGRWLAEFNGASNIYFHVNPTRGPLIKKAEREDVAALAWLHVDIDPRADEDLEAERSRALALLTTNLPASVPPPTAIVFSGGGYQAFWKLADPFPIDGNLERAEEAKLWNLALERAFSADKCHNVDRIMRLPGTINLPDAKKLKKGRVPTLATLVEFNDNVYPLEAFAKAPPLEAPAAPALPSSPGPAAPAQVWAVGPRLESMDELARWNVPDRVCSIIVRGHNRDMDGPKKGDDSRSAWVYDATCNLVRCDVPREMIMSILTDPNWSISEHILENARPVDYARHQIRRAEATVAQDPPRPQREAPLPEAGGGGGDDGEPPRNVPFTTDEEGKPKPSQGNIREALRRFGVTVAFNEFAHRDEIEGLEGFDRHLSDPALNRLWLATEHEYGFRPTFDYFCRVVQDLAQQHKYHPVRDYLDGLKWDGTPRIDTWLTTYLEATDSPYARAVSRLLLIAAVRRVREPGCKFDEMVVLESPQGMEKSTALRTLAVHGDWFSDNLPLGVEGRIVVEQTSGKWIVEAPELKGLQNRQTDQLKSFLSRQVERARLSYGRLEADFPRHFVIVGTTNEDRYLQDRTGNRRFWPIKVGVAKIEDLARDRDQLWAEAAAAEAAGESIRLARELWTSAGDHQGEREIIDPWSEILDAALTDRVGKISSETLWNVLNVDKSQRTQASNSRLSAILKKFGWEHARLRFDGIRQWGYVKGVGAERERVINTAALAKPTGEIL